MLHHQRISVQRGERHPVAFAPLPQHQTRGGGLDQPRSHDTDGTGMMLSSCSFGFEPKATSAVSVESCNHAVAMYVYLVGATQSAGEREEECMAMDAGWTQVALAVVTLVVTFILFRSNRQAKALAYAIVDNRPLVMGPSQFPLEVRYGGHLVKNPRLVVWRLANSGGQPIEVPHFEEAISFKVAGAKILSSEVTKTRPSTFRPTVEQRGDDMVVMERRLMNPGDLVEVQMLIDGLPEDLRMESRIAGISQIEQIKVPLTSLSQPWKLTKADRITVAIPSLLFGGLGIAFYEGGINIAFKGLGIVLFFVFVVIWPWQVWRASKRNAMFLGV